MKKSLAPFLLMMLACSLTARAEEAATVSSPTEAPAAESAPAAAPADVATPVPVPGTVPTPDVVPDAAPAAQDAALADNLEFVSGEVNALDEAGKTVSIKLYGENEDTTSDKTLKVGVDENTDITDGEQDRDLKSLATGTEVDVEYDPATNKATYIFVY